MIAGSLAKTSIIVGTPLTLIVFSLAHGLDWLVMHGMNDENYDAFIQYIVDIRGRWLAVHLIGLVLFPLLGVAIWLMLPPGRIASRISQAGFAVYIVLYSAFDAVAGIGGAHVVGLVDHDRGRLARRPPAPEPREYGARGDRLLLARGKRAQINDKAARSGRIFQLRDQRLALGPRPDAPAVDAQVACAELQGVGRDASEVLDAADTLVLDERGQLPILLVVHQRVEPQRRGLLRGTQLAETHADARRAAGAAAHGDRVGHRSVALDRVRILPVARLSKAHVVRVGIKHDYALARLHPQLLEQHP